MARLRIAVLTAIVATALLTSSAASAATGVNDRTVSHTWERARVMWYTTLADGRARHVDLHWCDTVTYDSARQPRTIAERHVCVRSWTTSPDGSVVEYTALLVPVGEALHLDTALKGARVRLSGTGSTTVSVRGVVVEERPATISADIRLTGTGSVVSSPGGSEGVVDGQYVTVTAEHLLRGGTWTGYATIDGASAAGPAGTGAVELLHTSTVTNLSPMP